MASQMMEKHDISPFPYGTGNLERFTAAWKMDTFRNSFGTKIERTPCRMFTASSSLKKPIPVDSQAPNYLDIPDQVVSFSFQKHVLEEERSFDPSLNLWDVTNFDAGMDAHLSRDRTSGTSSFSRDDLCLSSLSEFLDKKLQLSSNDVESVTSHYKEETFDSREEIEAQTIGDLLPKDNDLLSGLVDGLINIAQPSLEDGIEDLDLFSSVAGMDLIDGTMSVGNTGCLHTGTSVSLAGENPYHERLSRTLLVRSVDNNVEDFELQALFEQYGDIHRLFTGNKHRGFVMVSYFDIRAARNALQALQNKPLRCRRLDIHYSIPKGNPLEKDINQGTLVIYNLDYAVSNDYLLRIFGIFGDIKEIHERSDQKYIEFYDVRAANKALLALNHNDIAGKPITVESSYCGGIRHSWNDTMHASVDSFPWERADNTHLGTSRSCDEIANGFGKAENGKGNFHRHHRMSSNSKHFGSTPTSIWPSLPLFCSDFSHLHGLSRSPANSTLPINGHHVGPTPAVAPSLWNRLSSSYERVSLEGSRFHQGPRGRIHGSRQHHHRVTSNMFPCVDGYCMEIPIKGRNLNLHAQQRASMMYTFMGQNNMLNTFESLGEHAKSRKNESSSGQVDNKKQYKLDIDKIRRGEDGRTTLMIKNIPNKYTSKLLMAAIDECHRGTYDFIYLPIDFKNKCNVGYAFINMVDPSHIIPVYKTLNGKRWEKFNSEKVASLAYARIQGKAALIAHFQNSSLMNEDKRCRPILFHSDGLNVGDQVPFPMGANIRSRPGRSRSSNIEGNHQES